jgi:hypothetical protein
MDKLTLAIDLGGSTTRTMTKPNAVVHTPNQVRHVEGHEVQNFSKTPRGEFRILQSPFAEINNRGEDDFYAKDESIGNYSGKDIAPNNQSHKVTQKSTLINLIYAIATNMLDAADTRDVYLGMCIPAAELYQAAANKTFTNQLTGAYSVEFPRINTTLNFELSGQNVTLQGEGLVAFVDFLFEGTNNKKFAKSTVLVIDVGYRSTELILLKDGKALTYTAMSPEIGGINLEAEVSAQLVKQGVIGADVRSLIRSGELRRQDGKMAAGKIVRTAKQLLANQLVGRIVEMTTRTTEVGNIHNITDIFATGRCFSIVGKDEYYTGNLLEDINAALGLHAGLHRSLSFGEANIMATFKQLQRFVTGRESKT